MPKVIKSTPKRTPTKPSRVKSEPDSDWNPLNRRPSTSTSSLAASPPSPLAKKHPRIKREPNDSVIVIDDDDSNQDDGEDESEDDEELEVKVQNEAAATVKIKNEAGQPQYEMGLEWVPEIVPPSSDVGRRVVWDANVKIINTTKAKKLYKLNDNYLAPLDRQRKISEATHYPVILYSEHQVQQQAFAMRGGPNHFRAYVQKLQNTKVKKAANKGLEVKPLSFTKPPFALVPYAKRMARKDWKDTTGPVA